MCATTILLQAANRGGVCPLPAAVIVAAMALLPGSALAQKAGIAYGVPAAVELLATEFPDGDWSTHYQYTEIGHRRSYGPSARLRPRPKGGDRVRRAGCGRAPRDGVSGRRLEHALPVHRDRPGPSLVPRTL